MPTITREDSNATGNRPAPPSLWDWLQAREGHLFTAAGTHTPFMLEEVSADRLVFRRQHGTTISASRSRVERFYATFCRLAEAGPVTVAAFSAAVDRSEPYLHRLFMDAMQEHVASA